MVAAVESDGGRILDILVCPHLPGDGCGCRKPAPGLLLDAQRKHRIDFSAAVMIGDSATDIECALSAGVRTAVLVRTGNGAEAERELAAGGVLPDVIADDLSRAVEWIITTIR
jgi:D-glycero-D-manno-heptose 1,7-bisphosphate phosphatase